MRGKVIAEAKAHDPEDESTESAYPEGPSSFVLRKSGAAQTSWVRTNTWHRLINCF